MSSFLIAEYLHDWVGRELYKDYLFGNRFNRVVTYAYPEFGKIDLQKAGFWHQRLDIFGIRDSICVFRNSLGI